MANNSTSINIGHVGDVYGGTVIAIGNPATIPDADDQADPDRRDPND